MSATTWEGFASTVASGLAGLVRGDTVIISRKPHYVQLAHVADRVHVEAVGSRGLPADRQLTAGEEGRLVALGWTPPLPNGPHNYWCELATSVSAPEAHRLARLLADTLREVYGVDDPARLTVDAWNDETGGDLDFRVR